MEQSKVSEKKFGDEEKGDAAQGTIREKPYIKSEVCTSNRL